MDIEEQLAAQLKGDRDRPSVLITNAMTGGESYTYDDILVAVARQAGVVLTRTSVIYTMNRLAQAGILAKKKNGHNVRYTYAPHATIREQLARIESKLGEAK